LSEHKLTASATSWEPPLRGIKRTRSRGRGANGEDRASQLIDKIDRG
jgi:hypothetical protein